jgi:flagellar protein FlgJ
MIAGVNLADRLAVDVQAAGSLRAKAASGDSAALRAAATQFEAMLLQIVLKTMRATRFSAEDDPLTSSSSLKLYNDLLDQQWAQRISAGKGLGFADAMYEALSRGARRGVSNAEAAQLAPAETTPREAPASLGTQLDPRDSKSQRPADTTASDDPRQAFIDGLRPEAESVAAALGVPAEFILAQAALETGWGRRRILDEVGGDSHNLFGIKAGASWSGAVVERLTTEYQHGVPVKKVERFRAYASHAEAMLDYARLLRQRYPQATAVGDSAETFVDGLVAGGYATDPAYGDKLRRLIAQVA